MSPPAPPTAGSGISVGHILWRLIAVALGWLAAVAASAAVVALTAAASVLPATQAFVESPDGPILAALSALATRLLRALALGPTLIEIVWPGWLVAALLAEIAGSRSFLLHFAGAAVIAVAGLLATMPPPDAASVRLILAAALVAGPTHWLVAGRGAGFALRPTRDAEGGDPRPPHA